MGFVTVARRGERSGLLLGLTRIPADKIFRRVDAPLPLVFGHFRIRTQRPSAPGLSVCHTSADQLRGSGAVLHPIDDWRKPVYRVAAYASPAVTHPRN